MFKEGVAATGSEVRHSLVTEQVGVCVSKIWELILLEVNVHGA